MIGLRGLRHRDVFVSTTAMPSSLALFPSPDSGAPRRSIRSQCFVSFVFRTRHAVFAASRSAIAALPPPIPIAIWSHGPVVVHLPARIRRPRRLTGCVPLQDQAARGLRDGARGGPCIHRQREASTPSRQWRKQALGIKLPSTSACFQPPAPLLQSIIPSLPSSPVYPLIFWQAWCLFVLVCFFFASSKQLFVCLGGAFGRVSHFHCSFQTPFSFQKKKRLSAIPNICPPSFHQSICLSLPTSSLPCWHFGLPPSLLT